ncbi:MAG: tetratricopeptide repeat protein [Cyanobacteria bacterium J06621_8]
MLSKIKVKRLLIFSSIKITLLFSILTPVVHGHPTLSPVSQEMIDEAQHVAELGKIKAEFQNYSGAIADFSKAIVLNPNEADFYYQRGLILRELSDLEAAIRDFDDAILRNPRHAWAYLQRAGIFFNVESNQGLTSFQGLRFRQTTATRGDTRGILDLKTARELFAQQGDREGLETAERLIQHFAGGSDSPDT